LFHELKSTQYTLFADASRYGTAPVRALFYEFPDEKELFSVDRQYMIGKDLLVTPVLTPNVSTVDGKQYEPPRSLYT
jgi:alpha-glucosidase